jgi:hypothetical protein
VTGISSLLNRTLLFSSIYRSTLFLGLTVYQSVRSWSKSTYYLSEGTGTFWFSIVFLSSIKSFF